jgi:hypothetical protein
VATAKQAALAQELEDLIGGAEDDSERVGGDLKLKLDLSDVFAGVTNSWLAHAFQMDTNTVKKKLARCPELRTERTNKIYSLRQAAGYLVAPKVDISQWIKTLNPKDLPPLLQDSYWSAMLKRQAWEEKAGDLWRTEQVLEVLGEVAKAIKTSVMLWGDNIQRVTGITDKQMQVLTEQQDGLLGDLHRLLVTQPEQRQSRNMLAELDSMGEAQSADELI